MDAAAAVAAAAASSDAPDRRGPGDRGGPPTSASAQTLLAVGDHLELVAQLIRGQAAAQGADGAGELEELLAALSRSSAALVGQAGPAAAGRQRRCAEDQGCCRPPPRLVCGDEPTAPEEDDPDRRRSDSRHSTRSSGFSPIGDLFTSRRNLKMSHSNPALRAVEKFVHSPYMELVSALLIAINTMFMILEGQFTGARIGNEIGIYSYYGSDRFFEGPWLNPPDFVTIDMVFCVLFTVELLLRLAFLRLEFLCDPWGWLDISIVLTTDTTTFLVLAGEGGDSMPITTLRVLRLTRLLRIMRLARQITAFDSLYLMTTALYGSMTALMWIVAFLLLAQTLFALALTNIVQDFYLSSSGGEDEFFQDPGDKEKVYRYFGTYWRSMVSLFELMLANWPPICRMMMESMHEVWSVFALGYKLFMGVAVIGVIMGVFTQETFRAADTDDQLMIRRKASQTNTHRKKMRSLFEKMEFWGKDAGNTVDMKLFKRVLEDSSMKLWLKAMDYDINDASLLFYLIDRDGDGLLTVDELIEGMASLKGGARNIDVKVLIRQSPFGKLQGQRRRDVNRMTAVDALRLVESTGLNHTDIVSGL